MTSPSSAGLLPFLLSYPSLPSESATVPSFLNNPSAFTAFSPAMEQLVESLIRAQNLQKERVISSEERDSTSPCSVTSQKRPAKDKESLDYLERRKRNNDSAKRSREIRRQREQSNREKKEMLEQENNVLRNQIALLKAELNQMALLLIAHSNNNNNNNNNNVQNNDGEDSDVKVEDDM